MTTLTIKVWQIHVRITSIFANLIDNRVKCSDCDFASHTELCEFAFDFVLDGDVK